MMATTVQVRPPLGAYRISPAANGTYQINPAGQWADVVGVRDRFGEWVDICAWLTHEPQRWWLRLGGEATPILGAVALAIAAAEHEPIALHATPQQWALAKIGPCIRPPGACRIECATCSLKRGACILRWDVDLRELFEGVRQIVCDGDELERWLLRSLRSWEPRVGVAQGGRRIRRAA